MLRCRECDRSGFLECYATDKEGKHSCYYCHPEKFTAEQLKDNPYLNPPKKNDPVEDDEDDDYYEKKYPVSSLYTLRKYLYGAKKNGVDLSPSVIAKFGDEYYSNKLKISLDELASLLGYSLISRSNLNHYQYKKHKKIKVAGKSYCLIPFEKIPYVENKLEQERL